MRTLVTGGAGFIGSNLVDALVARGHEVTVVDDLSRGRRENLTGALAKGARLTIADVRDSEALARAFGNARPERVFHLAAQVSVRRSTREPLLDASVNVLGTINALTAAREAGTSRFVSASTGGAIYGDTDVRPTPEEHAASPKAPYGQSKLVAEGYCELFRRLHGLASVSLRYSNVYGPRQDPHGEAGVVAILCGERLAGVAPTVFGDGLQTRDYVYVGDVVDATIAAAEGDAGGVLNVGTGIETSVLDVIGAVARLGEGPFKPRHEPERPGESRHTALDAARASKELGWTPEVRLDEGIRRTIASIQDAG